MNKTKFFLPIFLITIFLDQSTKFLATILGADISYNSGISFHLFENANQNFLTFLLFLLIFFLFFNLRRYAQENSIAVGLFFGGATANLFDRVFFGAVRDWIPIPFTQIQNNLADWAIFAGIFLLVYPFVVKKWK